MDTVIRPMTAADVPMAERLSAEAFWELDRRLALPGTPTPELRSAARAAAWIERTQHVLGTDPGGCWVAEDSTGAQGVVVSSTRELMWILATYAVRPGLQGRGIGVQLLAAALHHGRGCLRGMLSSSADPRAVRRYRLAGFSLHPQLVLSGTVDRAAIPVLDHVREGTGRDLHLLDSLDRRTRGAAHGPDHALLLGQHRLLVSESSGGQGYAYVDHTGRLALLAASERRTASRLLWTVLADGPAQTDVAHLTTANEWALDVGLAARLEVRTQGYLGVRGMDLPAAYVHHGALL